jgi:hypothetical protein
VSNWQCPWCGAPAHNSLGDCPASCGWTAAGPFASLAAITIDGMHHAATGSNPARARESLAMALRTAGLDQQPASKASIADAPDAGPWSFRWDGGQFVDVSRPGAVDVDVVDMWDVFDFDWVRVGAPAEFLRLCRRWLADWADRFEREGD